MSSASGFRDLTGLTAILKACLAGYLVVSLIAVWSGWGELQMLQRAMAGAEVTEAQATASDTRQAMAGILYMLVFIVTAVLFLRWTVLASRNARALGANGMRFTPGWSAGWYFVPIAGLWKPYQAMAELFRASHPDFTDDWKAAPRPGILPAWWTLWILATFVGNAAARLASRGETLEQLVSTSWVHLLSATLDIPLGVAALVVVSKLSALQAEKHARVRLRAA